MLRRNDNISSMLAGHIAAGDFPSAVYVVAEGGRVIFADAMGQAVNEPAPRQHAANLDTIYDLASLTKPLVTGLLCARRIECGEFSLDDEVRLHLPEFDRPDKRTITLGQLLTHTSGLPAWLPLYIEAEKSADVLRVIAERPLEAAPGARVRYSDLGFITLGRLLENLSGAPLAELARREIFDPLLLERTFFNPDASLRAEVAACELGNGYEREMCREMKMREWANWREQLIWGEVHDGNAHFLGGAAGHAGLFSTARETLRLAQQFVPGSTLVLRPATCALFRTNMTEGMEEARSVAWQLAVTDGSTAGPSLPPDSFGHTGFTGTSCWIDAARERIFILLTNRTHARSLPFVNINSVRRSFHRLAVAALEKEKDFQG
ncbi:MAG TPA: serine hydrolase domain-containing protein [Pyrinomonadaceae bacterium]|jgi:CubicO group peptidase (beta-lactamase class C family)